MLCLYAPQCPALSPNTVLPSRGVIVHKSQRQRLLVVDFLVALFNIQGYFYPFLKPKVQVHIENLI